MKIPSERTTVWKCWVCCQNSVQVLTASAYIMIVHHCMIECKHSLQMPLDHIHAKLLERRVHGNLELADNIFNLSTILLPVLSQRHHCFSVRKQSHTGFVARRKNYSQPPFIPYSYPLAISGKKLLPPHVSRKDLRHRI